MDESRKQFEEWVKYYHGIMPGDLCYANMVEMHWKAWQASRAAIEIELPDEYTYDEEVREHASQVISDCAEAIRAAGIKVKE